MGMAGWEPHLARAALEPFKDRALVIAPHASQLGFALGRIRCSCGGAIVAIRSLFHPLPAWHKYWDGRPFALAICSPQRPPISTTVLWCKDAVRTSGLQYLLSPFAAASSFPSGFSFASRVFFWPPAPLSRPTAAFRAAAFTYTRAKSLQAGNRLLQSQVHTAMLLE